MNWAEIDNAWAFAGMLVFILANLVITIIGQRRGIKCRDEDRKVLTDVKDNTEVVRDEVQNEHVDDNLRHQLDRVERDLARAIRLVEENTEKTDTVSRNVAEQGRDIGGIRSDIGGMRGELREDRGNLSDLETRINRFIRREHPGADPL